MRIPPFPVRLVRLAVLLLLGGCATTPPPLPAVDLPALSISVPVPVAPRATATDRFVLAPGQSVVGTVQVTVATAEDTLPDIARRFDIGYDEIVRANPGVDPWLPGAGREIVLPTAFVLPDAPHDGLVVNIAAMRLYYYPKVAKGAAAVVITHPIGIGRIGWQTPEGQTRVTGKQKDPVWTPPASVRREHLDNGDPLPARVPAGPDNPLGAHLFRLEWPGYLVHGTNKPYGVGMRSSHGCIRLYPEDIAALFDRVPVGTSLRVVNQPTVAGRRDGVDYVQAYGHLADERHNSARSAAERPVSAAASRVARQANGLPIPVSEGRDTSLLALVATAARVANQLPVGALWDGRGGTPADEQQYAELLRDRDGSAEKP